jgi:hypothetical protein
MGARRRVRLCTIALAVASAFAATPAAALSLGNADVTSFLGQPLQMRVPVVLDDPSDAGSTCLRLVNQPGGDVPSLAIGRLEVERGVTGSYLRVTTTLPIDEPVLRVVLEIGCTQRVRREFMLLLDPPAGIASGASPSQQTAQLPAQIEFGPPQVVGVRGQPLLVNVPLSGELVSSLNSSCVNTARSDSADLPRVINDARVALVDRDGARSLRIHTPEPVNDARVRVIVEVGCDRPVRREFVLQVEAPRLAATPAEESAPVVPAAAVKRQPKPVARVVPPPAVRPVPPSAPAVPPRLAAPATAETPATQAPPEVQTIEPARLPPREPPAKTDRLVLAAPEDQPKPPSQDERDAETLKRLEELSAEVKKLRAELDASAVRNRELAEKADNVSYAWAAAAGGGLLLALGIALGWRSRGRNDEPPAPADRAGPMTRILGTPSKRPTPATGPMTDGAGPATIAAIQAAHRAALEPDTNSGSTAIMVTEFRDTTQVIGELYSPYIERGPTTAAGPATQPGPQTKTEIALDLDLGQERTTVFSPQTKTEIAVDIDVFERNSQIGRDLQREYERLDMAAGSKPVPAAPKPETEPDPSTVLGGTTMPMTTKLALDLDLDLSTTSQGRAKKPE